MKYIPLAKLIGHAALFLFFGRIAASYMSAGLLWMGLAAAVICGTWAWPMPRYYKQYTMKRNEASFNG